MTKPTTDPIKLLEANILELQTSLEHGRILESNALSEMTIARKNYEVAVKRHERKTQDVKSLEDAMTLHREAIAQLSSLQSGATIVVNLSPIPIDDDVPAQADVRDIEDEEDEFERIAMANDSVEDL